MGFFSQVKKKEHPKDCEEKQEREREMKIFTKIRRMIQKGLVVVTVAIGSLLALAVLGSIIAYIVWGSVILKDSVDEEGGNYCDDEHIWVYVLFCVILVASGLCCGIGLCNQAVCRRNEQGEYQPGMFPVITATVALGIFAWGLLQYLLISGACRAALKQAYPALWTFFFVSFVIQAFGAILQLAFFIVLCFLPDRQSKEPSADQALPGAEGFFKDAISSADPKPPRQTSLVDLSLPLEASSDYIIGLMDPVYTLSDSD